MGRQLDSPVLSTGHCSPLLILHPSGWFNSVHQLRAENPFANAHPGLRAFETAQRVSTWLIPRSEVEHKVTFIFWIKISSPWFDSWTLSSQPKLCAHSLSLLLDYHRHYASEKHYTHLSFSLLLNKQTPDRWNPCWSANIRR